MTLMMSIHQDTSLHDISAAGSGKILFEAVVEILSQDASVFAAADATVCADLMITMIIMMICYI